MLSGRNCTLICSLFAFATAAIPALSNEFRPIKAAFISPGKAGEVYWDMVAESLTAAGRQLGIEVETLRGEHNYRRTQELGLEVVSRATKPDVIITSNNESAAIPILQAADAAGIKVLLFNSELAPKDAKTFGPPRTVLRNWIGNIVADYRVAGARMGQLLIAAAREKGLRASDGKIHLLAIGGDETTPSSIERNEGFLKEVAKSEDVVIDRMLFANWNATEAEVITRNFLNWAQRRNIRIAGIWAANDPIALGALKAVSETGQKPGTDIFVAGLNWSTEAIERVLAGDLLLTDGGHFLLGTWSAVLLRDYFDGCDFASENPTVTFRTSAITRETAPVMKPFVSSKAFARLDVTRLLAKRRGTCGHYDFSLDALVKAVKPETVD